MKYPKTVSQVIILSAASLFLAGITSAGSPEGDPEKTVKIGLLIQDNKSVAAKQGAELAVSRANRKGGLNGTPFELVVRSMEGPWGTGSKQAVDLIFSENVWALLGSHDGRNAHLVEQAATKSIIPFISAWAGDPSLSQAFVPWFFNCVPNDQQQAEMLYNEIYVKRKMSTVAVISGSDYDSKTALKNFLGKTRSEQKTDPVQFRLGDYKDRMAVVATLTADSGAQCIVLLCNPSEALIFLNENIQSKTKVPLFSMHYIHNEDALTDEDLKFLDDNILFVLPEWSDPGYRTFTGEYNDAYGSMPGLAATYAFDSMCMLIEAIRNAGSSDRELIQKSLEKIVFEGVSGTIRFDDTGNRKGPFTISKLRNGAPSLADK